MCIPKCTQPHEQKGKKTYRHIQTETHKHTQTHPVTHIFQTCLFAHTEIYRCIKTPIFFALYTIVLVCAISGSFAVTDTHIYTHTYPHHRPKVSWVPRHPSNTQTHTHIPNTRAQTHTPTYIHAHRNTGIGTKK